MPKAPISIEDYNRIFRVIHSVLEGVEADTAHACLFFSITGAIILQDVYGFDARPVAGAAFYCVNGLERKVLAMASRDPNEELSSNSGFHCWTICNGFALDFIAPIFREAAPGDQFSDLPRRMFQKSLSAMSDSPEEFTQDGQFALFSNPELTRTLLADFERKAAHRDLVLICKNWFRRSPFRMNPLFKIHDNCGVVTSLRLSQLVVRESW